MESVALTYAKALFLLSLDDNKSEEILQQTKELSSIISSNRDFIRLFDSKVISKEDKKDIIVQIFNKDFDKSLINFMKLLVDKSRIQYLGKICQEYNKLYLEHNKIKEAKIYSASKLSDAKVEELKKALEEKYNSEFIVENFIDESLLAGIKIIIGDLVIDGSVNNRLEKMKASIAI